MGILHNRNYRLLFTGQIISTIGDHLFALALPWYVYTMTGSKMALALTGVGQTLPVILGLFVGVWVDRWRKQRVMAVSDGIRAFLSLGLFLLAVSAHASVAVLVLLVFALQAVGTFFYPAAAAILPRIVDRNELSEATGLNQSGNAAAGLVGTFGGGLLLTIVGAPVLFIANAVSFAASLVTLLLVRVNEVVDTTHREGFRKEWIAGVVVIRKSPTLLRVTWAGILANFAGAAVPIALAAWVKTSLHGGGLKFGTLSAVDLVGILVGGLLLARLERRLTLRHIMLFGLLASGLAVALVPLVERFFWPLLFLFISGVAVGAINGALSAMTLKTIPQEALGRVLGTLRSAMTIAQPLGMAAFGALLVYLPLAQVFVLMGAGDVAAALLFVRVPADSVPQRVSTEIQNHG